MDFAFDHGSAGMFMQAEHLLIPHSKVLGNICWNDDLELPSLIWTYRSWPGDLLNGVVNRWDVNETSINCKKGTKAKITGSYRFI